MAIDCEIDRVDREIILSLQEDSRRPFTDIARSIGVSAGTVHGRVERLKEEGILHGTRALLNPEALGLDVCAFVGVVLDTTADYGVVLRRLRKFPEVTEAYYTTGKFTIFIKVYSESNRSLHDFLVNRLQQVRGVRSTETLMILDNPILRDVNPLAFAQN